MTTPDDSTNWTPDQNAEFFRGLRALKRASGSNKHEQATNLIHALLDARINTRRRIVGALRELEFNHQHVVITLKAGLRAGNWSCDDDGYYRSSSSPP
ncbi:hypothetical protein [Sphingomonas bacterium]|uniref:hypothetical protein n=1 Tax=Sphingomonas bacterium TaxID=1895847 RepID=UPI001576CC73|nr:hypothetical protein [Sphingomonas bacterium]